MAAVDPPLFRWRNEEGTKKTQKQIKLTKKKESGKRRKENVTRPIPFRLNTSLPFEIYVILFLKKNIFYSVSSNLFSGFTNSNALRRRILGPTEFYWVLPCFTGYLPGFIRFFWLLSGYKVFTRYYLVVARFHLIFQGFTRYYRVLKGFTGMN